MGRQMVNRKFQRLSAVAVNSKREPGMHLDGNSLYLQVSPSGSKSWILRYTLNERTRDMGLGSTNDWKLAEVREQARKYRQLLDSGIDPIEYRKADRERNLIATANRRTFEDCAHEYYKLHAGNWKNAKHAEQWINSLTNYAFPIFGKKDISNVVKSDVLRCLEPIWTGKPETASRVKQRIRAVLDWSSARDYRVDHDPHLWDQIARSLPQAKDVKKVTHFAACPYTDVHTVMKAIKASNANQTVRNALEFIILTASRTGTVRAAVWSEIDLKTKRWVIPAERMKASKEHRVPLSARAIEILKEQEGQHDELIFPSGRGSPFSDMTFTMVLRRLGYEFTVHGFRSTFRDWCAEQTAYPREVCEAALAHSLKDASEAAYFRSDLFEKRRQLMDVWSAACAGK